MSDGRPLAGVAPVVSDLTLQIPKGSPCLLIGPNGAGKTTFLKILGGKHMVPERAVTVLGQPPFHATTLTATGKLAYLGGNWERDIAFAGYSIPLQVIEMLLQAMLESPFQIMSWRSQHVQYTCSVCNTSQTSSIMHCISNIGMS